MRNSITLLFILIFSLLHAQENSMQKGFSMLEVGDFQEAEVFFDSYLKTDPDNKTAKLCYGRAVGLSGEPEKANKIFASLLKKYPQDFEVQINYNESFLWAKKYLVAKPLYEKLAKENPDKFGAVLGYANTLSNLKEYPKALEVVEQAIALQPENESAKVSKKYMNLGFANYYVNKQEYKKGLKLLNEIFVDFKEDKDALLNIANVHLIMKNSDKAIETYKRYATSPKDSITALNGIVLAHHIGEDDKTALKISEFTVEKVYKLADDELLEKTYNRYVQALIWNNKYKIAREEIALLKEKYPDRNWVSALSATYGMYTADFKLSLSNYDDILKRDSASFDGNLGKANALFASDKIIPAYQAAFQTLKVFKGQKDALGFIEKLNIKYTPYVEEHVAYTFDNGDNVAFSSTTNFNVPITTKLNTTLSYQFRTTDNSVTINSASTHVLIAGIWYKLLPKTTVKASLGINNSSFSGESYVQPVIDVKLEMQPFKLQNLTLGYTRELQSFNAELIEREIVMNHFGLNYNLGTNFKLGWYTQLMHTQQSDNNVRNILFTSLYYNLFKKPAFKFGLNFQYITFQDQVPTIYFSPEKYMAFELFGDLRGNFSEKTTYMLSAASGLQKVEDDDFSVIFRAEAGVKHQFNKRWSADFYAKYSNIASATAAGFEFTEIGFKVKWLFLKEPLFYKNIKK
ncbi:tetratricopeptide repeat protein [Cellulophaga baltica]|uniref:tetratricopeptide repeat protein n=1 Tax=Cellulophaga TaxID=104264 RepID=UPI001C068E3F|nr:MULTISPECIES: tetratricopeptide repeat protein [Cellulophaga]MBU2996687.1 tetratricopeptide repeat protein [Cellulophaga baltica]MDO6768081.1 tetratricopeptide repeat protein [Cellulophaga sp. 1_MG-2023]